MTTSAEHFRSKLEEDRPLLFAGVFDTLSARIAERGFRRSVVSGYGIAASRLGLPDIGYLTLTEMTESLRNIARAVSIPIVCDGEVGYGNAINVMRTVEEFIDAGAIGVQMGDAEYENYPYLGMPTQARSEEESLLKFKAVHATRGDHDFCLFATQVNALDRALSYARAGAEGLLFPWEPVLNQEAARCRALDAVIEAGTMPVAVLTPFLPPAHRDRLYEAGYKIIVLAVENLYAAAFAQQELWEHYMAAGSIAGFEDRMFTSQEDFLALVNEDAVHTATQRFLAPGYHANPRIKYAKGGRP